ncbi:membrane-associated protein [Deinococcus metalli]|uniref:Membrane protein n=1 Tax=Deinococcus metalli TaxID=1141878 RepID=A0A7W8NLT6_9DEIO|nr:DedA family protein [Deinococcus metalli]MBB5375034.1 membrane-associated protein [Deinococcus metalli]GHF31938.1 membrane protein [Deinococcus metalli]
MDSLVHSILAFSYVGIFLIVFAETGLLLGFFLPGDSLLITAGLLAASGDLSLGGVIVAVVAGGILGCISGYFIGQRFGPAVFRNQESRFFKPEYVTQAEKFFEQYGWQSVVLARFVPIVRTLVPTLAGVSRMPLGVFTAYNVLGALLWGVSLPALAYYFGKLIPNLDRYVLLIVAVVLVVSVIPVVVKVMQARRGA